ncbi:hypothetical protein JCM31271_34760 [Halorubrum trueperi]
MTKDSDENTPQRNERPVDERENETHPDRTESTAEGQRSDRSDTAERGNRETDEQPKDVHDHPNVEAQRVGPHRGSVHGLANKQEHRDSGQPHVSVTIEGDYTTVFERLDHPHSVQQNELDATMDNLEETLLAVLKSGGGIRSEIYEAATFELDDPWEIRKYLAVLDMHNLIHQQEDQWVPSDYFEASPE